MALDNLSVSSTSSDSPAHLGFGEKLSLEASQLLSGIANGAGDEFDSFLEHPVKTATALGVTVGLSIGLTAISYRHPQWVKPLRALGMGLVTYDLTGRALTTAVAGADTWASPEHYEANKAKVGQALGAGLMDYTVLGLSAEYGVMAGETNAADRVFRDLTRKFENVDIPKLLMDVEGRPTASFEAQGTDAAELFNSQRAAVVRVKNDSGSGSGFFVDGHEGYIATNDHVADEELLHSITMSDGRTFQANLVARDRVADLALLKAQAPGVTEVQANNEPMWPSVEFGLITDLYKGSPLYMIGHPEGVEKEVLSSGFLRSAVPEPVKTTDGSTTMIAGFEASLPNLGGNSGSAIFDSRRKVVAVMSNGEYKEAFGPTVEHVKSMLEIVRAHEPIDGYLEIQSAAVATKAANGKNTLVKPVQIESSARVVTKAQLETGTAPEFRLREWPPEEYDLEGSSLYSEEPFYRALGTVGAIQTTHDMAKKFVPKYSDLMDKGIDEKRLKQ